MYDRWRVQRAQVKEEVPAHPWEAKGGLLYHIDLGLDLVIRVCCPVGTFAHCTRSSCCEFNLSTVMLLCICLWVTTETRRLTEYDDAAVQPGESHDECS